MAENQASLFIRFWQYQKERFPLATHGVLILVFTFSAISYSRVCSYQKGFISTLDFSIGVFVALGLFFLLRVFDEFKDKEDDAKYRTYLPVPRGLISLKELQWIALVVFGLQVVLISVFQLKMLSLYCLVLVYLLLMGKEFFVPQWIRARQMVYSFSHMLIIPLIDLYASGLDWYLESRTPHLGLGLFFITSYFNGMVLEFGRKIRIPEKEELGVKTYSSIYGMKKALLLWSVFLVITLAFACSCAIYSGLSPVYSLIFVLFFGICMYQAYSFLQNPTEKKSKYIEYFSALWTISMYLLLGAIPMLKNLN